MEQENSSSGVCPAISDASTVSAMKNRKPLTDEQQLEAERLKAIYRQRQLDARAQGRKLTQDDLADQCGWNTQSAVSQYLNARIALNLDALLKLSKALDFSPADVSPRLASMIPGASEGASNVANLRSRRPADSNAELVDSELLEGDEPLRPDEVWLPVFREVEFSAGDGATQVIENHGVQERFSLPRLSRYGVQPENAALATARGDSMVPAITDGATIGIDKGCTSIIDGKIFALDHGGMLRVKRLYRLPLGRVRVVSENADEYPEEVYSLADPDAPRILGRVFMAENPL